MKYEQLVEESLILPDEELKSVFKKYAKIQKFLSSIPVYILLPVLVVYGFMGYVDGFIYEYSLGSASTDWPILAFVDFICFAACGGLMASSNEKNFIAVPVIMLLEIIILDGLTDNFSLVHILPQIFIMIYLITSCIILKNIVKKMNYLRSLPRFPFDKRQAEIYFEAMPRKKMVDYLEREQSSGVKAVGYEEIFVSDNPEEIVSPTLKKEDQLQQHCRDTSSSSKAYLEKVSKKSKGTDEFEGYLQTAVDYDDFSEKELRRIRKKYAAATNDNKNQGVN